MPLTLHIKRISQQDDGSFTIKLSATNDETGREIGVKTFQVRTRTELKAKAKPLFASLVRIENKRLELEAIAQGVIDEIMAEVTQ
jgi:hypothetical protein